MIGMSLDVSSPRISERFNFITSLIYIPVTYHLSTTKSQPTADYFTVNIHELKIPFGIRYAFAPRKVTTYIMGGLSPIFNLGISSTHIQEVVSNGVVYQTERFKFPTTSNQFGIWTGVGIITPISPRLDGSLEFRFERTTGFTSLEDIGLMSAVVNNIQLVVGIQIKGAP